MAKQYQQLDEHGNICLTCNRARWECRCDPPNPDVKEVLIACREIVDERWSEANEQFTRLVEVISSVADRGPSHRTPLNRKDRLIQAVGVSIMSLSIWLFLATSSSSYVDGDSLLLAISAGVLLGFGYYLLKR